MINKSWQAVKARKRAYNAPQGGITETGRNMDINNIIPEYPEQAKKEWLIRHGMLSSIRLFRSWGIIVSEMTDEEAGHVFKQIFRYMKGKKINLNDDTMTRVSKAFLIMVINSVEDSIARETQRAIAAYGKTITETETENNGETGSTETAG